MMSAIYFIASSCDGGDRNNFYQVSIHDKSIRRVGFNNNINHLVTWFWSSQKLPL